MMRIHVFCDVYRDIWQTLNNLIYIYIYIQQTLKNLFASGAECIYFLQLLVILVGSIFVGFWRGRISSFMGSTGRHAPTALTRVQPRGVAPSTKILRKEQ